MDKTPLHATFRWLGYLRLGLAVGLLFVFWLPWIVVDSIDVHDTVVAKTEIHYGEYLKRLPYNASPLAGWAPSLSIVALVTAGLYLIRRTGPSAEGFTRGGAWRTWGFSLAADLLALFILSQLPFEITGSSGPGVSVLMLLVSTMVLALIPGSALAFGLARNRSSS